MNQVYAKLQNCYECVRKKTDFVPKVAIVLGSGLGDYAEQIRVVTEIPYAEIEGFPVSTVPGHAGKFIFGYLDEIPVVCMKGRVHYYEGYDVTDVVLPTRLMKLLGAKILFLTNAAGGVNTSFHAGDLMLIRDHISVFAPNPLIGANIDELGLRFPDMSHVYDKDLQQIIRETAKENDIYLQEGIYTQLTGPSFESPAEIRMLRTLGCDAVGMSSLSGKVSSGGLLNVGAALDYDISTLSRSGFQNGGHRPENGTEPFMEARTRETEEGLVLTLREIGRAHV